MVENIAQSAYRVRRCWAVGIVQNIDAAAMDLYVIYRSAAGDFTAPGALVKTDLDNLDMVIAGGRIQF